MPVVNVDKPKKETVPKSAKVSIPTKLNPMKIAGLADGSIILKNIPRGGIKILSKKDIKRLFS